MIARQPSAGPEPALIEGISVVIPAFNSELTLAALVERLHAVLGSLDVPYEIVLVNDGSRDGTWAVLEELARDRRVRAVDLMRNYGQHNALLCGIRLARHETVVTIDDDLQHPPEEIPKLLDKLGEGYDVVYGYSPAGPHEAWRNFASLLTKRALGRVMGGDIAQKAGAFRAFRTRCRQSFEDFRGPFVSIDALLTWGAGRFGAIEVEHHRREAGRSNYTFGKLTRHALNLVTFFTTWPLQVASLTGFAFTVLGLLLLVYVVVTYFIRGGVVPGFAFLASAISIFSGAQLFALGIIGEYLARIHARTLDRPPYSVAEVLTHDGR